MMILSRLQISIESQRVPWGRQTVCVHEFGGGDPHAERSIAAPACNSVKISVAFIELNISIFGIVGVKVSFATFR